MRPRVLLVSVVAALGLSTGTAVASGGPTMPLSDVQPGMDCTAETVVQGTTITSFGVHVIDVVQDPQYGPRILVSVSGPAVSTGIAEGMSGSPVFCQMPDGSTANAGAISSGIPGTNQGEVTPIGQMLGQPVLPPPAAARDSSRYSGVLARMRPLLGPLTIGGLSPAIMEIVQLAAAKAGRAVAAQPQGIGAANFPVQPLVPGASVAIGYSTGAVPIGAVGTVTYRNGQNVYGFGHELDGAGRRSLLLQDAWVDGVASNPLGGAFKLAAPGHVEGVLTSDTPDAVIGTVGAGPTLVPVDVRARDLDTGHTTTLDSQVADETDIGLPLGASLVDAVAPIEAAQAATDVFDGPPAFESGHMCLQIWLRESRRPLGFCDRYVGAGVAGDQGPQPPAVAAAVMGDLNTAFAMVEQVTFANLHVTRVSAQIDAQRGLKEGSLVSAQAALRVAPGKLVTVHLLVRLFRGGMRTISFHMRAPRRRGMFLAMLNGPAPVLPSGGGPQGSTLASGLGGIFSFGGSSSCTTPPTPSGACVPAPPSSVSQLRAEIAGIPGYDGLTVSSPGQHGRHVFRDASLLITGSAPLAFMVK